VPRTIPYIEFKYVYANIDHVIYDVFTHAQRVPPWDLFHESCNTALSPWHIQKRKTIRRKQ